MTRMLLLQTAFGGGLALLLPAPAAPARTVCQLDPQHSSAQFAVRHLMISTVRGQFRKITGTATLDDQDVTKSSVEVTIDATTIDSRDSDRDKDLKSANFLDVEKFPTITFKSKRVEQTARGKLKVTGDLTIHGVTKEVVLDVEGPSAPLKDPRGNLHAGASATTKINRQDFGLNWNRPVPGGVMVGNEVSITLDTEMIRRAE